MDGDMCTLSKAGFQCLFYFERTLVNSVQRQQPIHTDVQLDGIMVTDAASAQMVWIGDIRK